MLASVARLSRRHYATSTPPKPSSVGVMTSLLDILNSTVSTAPKPKSSGGSASQQQQAWKPFRPKGVLRPHELSFKARAVGPRPYIKRPAVGPPSRQARYADVFHQLDIDPLSQALNPAILANYLSDMGKVYGRNVTGLTFKSQRRIGKAVRRAKMMGIIPILSQPVRGPSWPMFSKHKYVPS